MAVHVGHLKPVYILLPVLATACFIWLQSNHPAVSSATPTCNRLSFRLSDDKSHYIFSALATPTNTTDITGYKFDFGDHQSYDVMFDHSTKTDRTKATTTHTYEKDGTYTASVHVLSKPDGKMVSTSSPACTVHVTVASQAGQELANTGPGNIVKLFALSTLTGGIAHHYFIRHRSLAKQKI